MLHSQEKHGRRCGLPWCCGGGLRFLKLQLLAPFLPTSSSAAFSFTWFFRCSHLNKKTNKRVSKVADLDKEITSEHSTQAKILNCRAAARTANCARRRSACKQQMELRPCIVSEILKSSSEIWYMSWKMHYAFQLIHLLKPHQKRSQWKRGCRAILSWNTNEIRQGWCKTK